MGVSHVEANPAEVRQELVLDDLFKMIDAGRPSLKLATRAVVILAPQHVHTVADAGDGGLHRPAEREHRPQLARGAPHTSIRIRSELFRQALDARQDQIDVRKGRGHSPVLTVPSPWPAETVLAASASARLDG
jgi:hypothetical protein